jgi:crotonobetainyl-CoA:carnitine CoA-transferase CaiB-like acyl-CoA transferase
MLAGAPNDPAWQRFCDALAWPELGQDARFLGNAARVEQRGTLVPMLEERFGRHPVDYWVDRFEARNVACAPLHKLDQVLTHPQVLANSMVVEAQGPDGATQQLVGTPFKLGQGGGTASTAAPALGADTNAILADTLGLSDTEIDTLRAASAFSAG